MKLMTSTKPFMGHLSPKSHERSLLRNSITSFEMAFMVSGSRSRLPAICLFLFLSQNSEAAKSSMKICLEPISALSLCPIFCCTICWPGDWSKSKVYAVCWSTYKIVPLKFRLKNAMTICQSISGSIFGRWWVITGPSRQTSPILKQRERFRMRPKVSNNIWSNEFKGEACGIKNSSKRRWKDWRTKKFYWIKSWRQNRRDLSGIGASTKSYPINFKIHST